jgi:DNA-binding NtrC family response regulator
MKEEAVLALKKYTWPGNIRELFKICERLSQSLSGIVDEKLVLKALPHDSATTSLDNWDEYILQNGLKALIIQIEKKAVEDSMKRNNGKITACIKELKISSSAFYRILQEHQLQF